MSAYIVDKDHINYLVSSALTVSYRSRSGHNFRWYHDGQSHLLDDRNGTETGQMLWDECIESVAYRYPNRDDGALPGETGDSLHVYIHTNKYMCDDVHVAQVLKATDCYEYQSCEHPGWHQSSAKAFIDSLRALAWRLLPDYERAEWGAPQEQRPNAISISSMINRR